MIKRGVKKFVCDAAIIGKKHQSCCVFVEPTDREDSLRHIYDVGDRCFVLICTAGHDATRLVVGIVDELFLIFDNLVTESDIIFVRINNLSDVSLFVIYKHLPGRNIFFCFSSRANTRL